MTEGFRTIALDGEMADPGARIADERRGEEEPPMAGRDRRDDEGDGDERAREMQRAAAAAAMRAEVARPELRVAPGPHRDRIGRLRHAGGSSVDIQFETRTGPRGRAAGFAGFLPQHQQ